MAICVGRGSHAALIHNFSIHFSCVAIRRNKNTCHLFVSTFPLSTCQAEADCFFVSHEKDIVGKESSGVEGEHKKHIKDRLHSNPFVVLLQISSGGKGGLFHRKLDGDFEVEFIRNHLWDNLEYLL